MSNRKNFIDPSTGKFDAEYNHPIAKPDWRKEDEDEEDDFPTTPPKIKRKKITASKLQRDIENCYDEF